MSNGDSFELLLNQLLKDVRVISENLELIGLFYVGKFTLKSLWCVSKAIYSFVLPRLVSNDGWIKSHGKWAIVNGCTSQNGLGFAVELAKKKFHLILVDSNKILLTKLADFLAEEHKIKTVCFEPSSISRLIYDLDVLKEVGLLINCPYPHHSERTYFHSVDQNSLNEQILLNVNIPIALSRSVLPSMLSRNKGLILFVTSTSAQLPTPYSAVLESSSPFLEKFAESLQFEYGRNKNICIQCLRMDNVGEGFGDENSLLDEKYLKNKRNFAGTARALKYLGWSKFATVEWTTALKIYTIKSFLPGFIFNPFYISILRRSFQ